MNNVKSRMEERILVYVYYSPNGERLIRRGHKLAKIMDCPLYVMAVDPMPYEEFDEEKIEYVEQWRKLCDELEVDRFILLDHEKRPIEKAIAEVAHQLNITQIIIGQAMQKRWEEITKGSFANTLLNEISFVDVHLVSADRSLKSDAEIEFEKGVRAFLDKDGENYRISFARSKKNMYKGIFYKEIGTDFNNGIFKFVTKDGKVRQVHITDDLVVGKMNGESNIEVNER